MVVGCEVDTRDCRPELCIFGVTNTAALPFPSRFPQGFVLGRAFPSSPDDVRVTVTCLTWDDSRHHTF
jgi:hypothetical protein